MAEKHPQLAEALEQVRDAVLEEWAQKLVDRLPKASGLSLEQLRNHLPVIFDELTQLIAEGKVDQMASFRRQTPSHGIARFEQHFTLNELIYEYQVLRQVTMRHVVGVLERPLRLGELCCFDEAFDLAVRRAAVAYAEFQADAIRLHSEATGRFLSFLSHDLRNTLNAAMLSMQLASDDAQTIADAYPDQQPLRQLVEDLNESRTLVGQTVRATERILESERLRQENVPVTLEEVQLNSMLESLICGMGASLSRERDEATGGSRPVPGSTARTSQCDGHVLLDMPPDLIVMTDRALLSSVMHNLVGNALKYGGTEPVTISATADDGHWKISVTDRGPGIPPEHLEHLFRPFHRGPTQNKGGSGLGLSIASRAASLVGGELSVDSQLGRGTTVTLRIPCELGKRNAE